MPMKITIEFLQGEYLHLRKDKIFLRSLTKDDINSQYLSWMNDPEITRYTASRNRHNNYQSLLAYLGKHDNRTSFQLGIFVGDGELNIGNFSIICDLHNLIGRTNVLIGDKEWWGTGIVLQARALILEFLFLHMGIYKVCGTPLSKNRPAIFNYQKQGFTVEGVERDQVLLGDGSRSDVIHFAMFKKQFLAHRK